MRILRPDGTVIEGDAGELARFERLSLFEGVAVQAVSNASGNSKIPSVGGDFAFVSTDVAYRAMTRIPLADEQRSVLKEAYDAGPKGITAAELQKIIGYSTREFAGLMGSFGRRVSFTPGYVTESAFFDQEWRDDLGCNIYRLPDSVRSAIEQAGIAAPIKQ